MNRRNLITAIIGIIVIATGIIVYATHFIASAQPIPAGKFVKISNIDLAPKGKVIIVEQSWYGCPVGAAASWAIYDVLQHYGNLSYELHYSDPDHNPANIPGLIFTGFNSTSVVEFYVAYVYNEYLNASYNGTLIPQNELISVGEQILEEEIAKMGLSPQVAQYIIQYETEVAIQQYGEPSALYVKPPHLNFAILISGPNGTYIVTTPIVNPTILEGYTPSYVLNNLDQFPQIVQAAQMIQNTILEAAGPLAGECPTI
ncbi:DUF929 domain-containing protein [Saccharolobus solfataricus]|uniref:DUF929 domain-containing protein n=1 Tax=Saccharolobus solfataricus TaxID=2287 RepID=A0A157T5D4_SACSO|nr:DUF929 domain-containing protein [Saccharolobus solfataricus]QPG50113.1 DUF929 domain-containing protein [Saccharolobus solfataricus]SAI86617.1 uncharacterised protein [Saccharolobus solfataricus]